MYCVGTMQLKPHMQASFGAYMCSNRVMHSIWQKTQALHAPSKHPRAFALLHISCQAKVLTEIHLCRNVLPQPKLRDRSLPVPNGMTATAGAGSSWSSRIVFSTQDTVPSPPAAKMRSRLHRHRTIAGHCAPVLTEGLKAYA